MNGEIGVDIHIRAANRRDAASVAAIYGQLITFEADIPTVDTITARARAACRWSCGVSVYVDVASRRRGVAGALCRELLSLLMRQNIGAEFAGLTLPTPASVSLHERVGFRAVGINESVGYKNGRWHDVGWWGKQLAGPAVPVAEPAPVREVKLKQQ